MNTEDLRLLIGQDIGLTYLMPLALEKLEQDPLAEGQHYAGDLLVNVLCANAKYYRANPEVRRRLEAVIDNAYKAIERLDVDDYDCTAEALEHAVRAFRLSTRL